MFQDTWEEQLLVYNFSNGIVRYANELQLKFKQAFIYDIFFLTYAEKAHQTPGESCLVFFYLYKQSRTFSFHV